jgi:mutator protein MutT
MGSNQRPHDIVCAAFVRNQEILLGLRTKDRRWFPGVWDFPGGHVGPGETANAALVREIREELAIDISEPSGAPDDRVTTREFDMKLWIIDEWDGIPANAAPNEHEVIGWFTEFQARKLLLAHESYPLFIERALHRAR